MLGIAGSSVLSVVLVVVLYLAAESPAHSVSLPPDDLFAILAEDAVELDLGRPSPPLPAHPTPAQQALIERLVLNMSLTEKVNLLTGSVNVHGYTGYIQGVPRLHVPALKLNDGPQGYRGPAGLSTAWPCGLALAATFSMAMVHQVAKAQGEEFRAKGANVLLGPGLNVARIPGNGRNFEYICGEDPWLGKTMAFAFVTGAQSGGKLMTTAKHFVNNDQETNRGSVNARVPLDVQQQVYYPPFAGAVQGGALSVMCAYNKVNGKPACSNSATLLRDLHGDLGFEGFVMSDWFATRDTINSALGGLDMEMPIPLYYGPSLASVVVTGQVPGRVVNGKVERVLSSMARCGLLDGQPALPGKPTTNATSDRHAALARAAVAFSVILLKNSAGVLPFKAPKTFLVIGDRAHTRPLAVGSGSGHVQPAHVVTAWEGISRGAPAGSKLMYADSSSYRGKASALGQVDVVVVCVGVASGEAHDRPSLALEEDDMVRWAAERHARVVVAVVAPGAVLMPWADDVAAIVLQFMPGQEAGSGLADVLFGKASPMGRLPVTIPYENAQVNFTKEQYPGVNLATEYPEKDLVGYRWYESVGAPVRFPFGFGLGFGAVDYVGVFEAGSRTTLAVALRNRGATDAWELVQVYATLPRRAGPSAGVKRLVSVRRVKVRAGAARVVKVQLALGALRVFREGEMQLLSGAYTFHVGSSVRHIRAVIKVVM